MKTAFLMALMTALVMAVGGAVGGRSGMLFALIFGCGMNIYYYWYSDSMVLSHYKAKPVDRNNAPRLYALVERLAKKAELPMPKVYIIPTDVPNAFATGRNPEHAAVAVSLIAGLLVGGLAQRTRFCMIAGIRDFLLFRETKMLIGFVTLVVAATVTNMCLGYVKVGFAGQPIAHADAFWNFLGLFLAGFACTLLGGCPMRQLVLAGEGNSDSAVTILGLIIGAAFCHNFGLASSAEGPTNNGKIAVIIGILVVAAIAYVNTFRKKD